MAIERLPIGDFHCEYNTYVFSPAAYTSAFNVRPNPDPAQRTVMSATYVATVVDYITADDDIPAGADPGMDPVVAAVVALLSRNGAVLKYRGRGFGNHVINAGGGKFDVKWGPWTKDIALECNGGRTVKISWTVEWTTVNCPDGLTKAGTILQFTYAVGYEIDKEGYTTRSYDATLTVAQTRKGVADKTLQTSADEHREKMIPALHPGFRRESQSHRLSLDKCTLTVSIRDTQMPPNMPPDGVVDGSIEHTWHSETPYRWIGTFSATYDIARKEGKASDAIRHFLALVKDRVTEAGKMRVLEGAPAVGARADGGGARGFGRGFAAGAGAALSGLFGGGALIGGAAGMGAGGGPAPAVAAPKVAVPPVGENVVPLFKSGSAAETNVLGRLQVRLSVQFVVSGPSFAEILRSGGLWKPFGEAAGVKGWKEWTASIPTVHGPRGHAMLKFDPKEDALVDACVPGARPIVPTSQQGGGGYLQQTMNLLAAEVFGAPSREASWIEYRSFATVHADLGRAEGVTLPTSPQSPSTGWTPGGQQVRGSEGEVFVHQRHAPKTYVTLTGQAVRAGWAIPIPELTEANGQKPRLVGAPVFTSGIVGYSQVPIMGAAWRLTYLLTA